MLSLFEKRLSFGKLLCSQKILGTLPQDGSVTAHDVNFNFSEVFSKHWILKIKFACN